MIFVARNADASANNIGRINIKSVDNITEYTKHIISLFGKNYTEEQQLAIDDFFISIEPYRNRITHLFAPILAKTNEKGSVIDGLACYDLISEVKCTARGFIYNTKKGLVCYQTSGNGFAILLPESENLDRITLTAGGVHYAGGYDNMFSLSVHIKAASFGAAAIKTTINFDEDGLNVTHPCVTTISRNKNSAYGVRNGRKAKSVAFNPETYGGNTSTINVIALGDTSKIDSYPMSIFFLCNGYCMQEEELMAMNDACLNLALAFWE